MAWMTNIPPGQIIVINGAEVSFHKNTRMVLHNIAHVIHPDGTEIGKPVAVEAELPRQEGPPERGQEGSVAVDEAIAAIQSHARRFPPYIPRPAEVLVAEVNRLRAALRVLGYDDVVNGAAVPDGLSEPGA